MADDEKPADQNDDKPMFDEAQQAFINDIINKRLSEKETKHAAEIKDLEKKHKIDLERSKMDEATRLKAEADDAMAQMTKRAETAERALRMSSAQAELAKRGLPVDFAGTIIGADDAETVKNAETFAKAFDEAVQTRVNEKVRTGAPRAPGDASVDSSLQAKLRQIANLPPKE